MAVAVRKQCQHGQQQSAVDSGGRSCVFQRLLQPNPYDLVRGLEYDSILIAIASKDILSEKELHIIGAGLFFLYLMIMAMFAI